MGHRFASARDERRKRNIAKNAKTPPTRDGVNLFGSGGRMAFAANAAQLVSAPVNRCDASGRLGLTCFLAGPKLAHIQMKKGPTTGPFIHFGSGGAFAKILDLYAEPFPLVA